MITIKLSDRKKKPQTTELTYAAGGKSDEFRRVKSFTYTGLAQNEYGWWYIRSGMLDFSYTGYVGWYGVNYRVQNGQVIF